MCFCRWRGGDGVELGRRIGLHLASVSVVFVSRVLGVIIPGWSSSPTTVK